jgi:hypothetical protein
MPGAGRVRGAAPFLWLVLPLHIVLSAGMGLYLQCDVRVRSVRSLLFQPYTDVEAGPITS